MLDLRRRPRDHGSQVGRQRCSAIEVPLPPQSAARLTEITLHNEHVLIQGIFKLDGDYTHDCDLAATFGSGTPEAVHQGGRG